MDQSTSIILLAGYYSNLKNTQKILSILRKII